MTRQSPAESATLFPVGTVKMGNDGNYWIITMTKNNIKRWTKDSSKEPSKIAKKSRRSSATKSAKSRRSSVKKSAKKSAKPRRSSVKKSAKSRRSSVKKSAKSRRSSKKSAKSRRSSVKKSAKSRRSSSKKSSKSRRSSVKKSAKSRRSSVKKSATKSVKKSATKSPKKSAKSRRSSSKKSAKKSAKKSTKKSAKKSPVSKEVQSPERPVPLQIPQQQFKEKFKVMLAHNYKGQNPIGYYMSEKLDGYRAILYKNHDDAGFFSRNNKPFNAPKNYIKEITDRLPIGTVLDGELYTKRGDFSGMGVIRKKVPIESEWNKITYMVFDLPLVNLPFKERYELMKKMLKGIPHIKIVENFEITDEIQFKNYHDKLVSQGAEGTMLRNPKSYYENKRSNHLLKVKDYFDDEVIVEGMEYGEGKNNQVMGNLIVRWAPHAKKKYKGTFNLGSGFTDEDRKNWKSLFNKGTVLTIKYFEIQSSGKPRFPIYQKIWERV